MYHFWQSFSRWLQLLGLTFVYACLFGVIVTVGDWAFSSFFPQIMSDHRLQYLSSLFSEFFGIVMTVIIVDRLNAHRQQRELEDELMVQVASRSNAFALYALDRLRHEKLLVGIGGRLQNRVLDGANWQSANLQQANLLGASLKGVNLCGANLLGAKCDLKALQDALMDGQTVLPNGKRYNPNDPYGFVGNSRQTRTTQRTENTTTATKISQWDV